MSDLLKAIEGMISTEVSKKTHTFLAKVTDINTFMGVCTVVLSNPNGAGEIQLTDRKIPFGFVGAVLNKVEVGSTAVMTCPMGHFTYATIASFLPLKAANSVESQEEKKLPRIDVTPGVGARLVG